MPFIHKVIHSNLFKKKSGIAKKAYSSKKPIALASDFSCAFAKTGFPGSFAFDTESKSIIIETKASATMTYDKSDFIEYELITP